MSRTDLPLPGRRDPAGTSPGRARGPAADPLRVRLDLDRPYHLSVYSLGLACCAVEFVALAAAAAPAADPADPAPAEDGPVAAGGTDPAAGPTAAQVLVVAGTVTDKMAPLVRRVYDAMPEPKYVISFGACSNCGGPYWDSYSVTKGVDRLVPVDVYVPGCPPRPDALLYGVQMLREAIAAGQGSP